MLSRNHLNHFQGGRMTPQEYHAKHAFPADSKCAGCGHPPTIRAFVFWPFDEVKNRGLLPPGELGSLSALAPLIVHLKGSDGRPAVYLRMVTVYCCNNCRPACERTVARDVPSWAAVDWDYGPKAPVIYST